MNGRSQFSIENERKNEDFLFKTLFSELHQEV